MTRPRARAGFTFLELIASLSVIVVVAAILFPVYIHTKECARGASCRSNLQQLGGALHLYAQDNDGRFPPADDVWTPLLAYTKNNAVFACPDDPAESRRYGVPLLGGPTSVSPVSFNSYEYHGGYANDDESELPLARDGGLWHDGGVNVLHLGGNVQWVTGRNAPAVSTKRRPRTGKSGSGPFGLSGLFPQFPRDSHPHGGSRE